MIIPIPTAAIGGTLSSAIITAITAPTVTLQICVRQATAEALNVGPTADIAPMVANTTFAVLVP